MVMDHGADHALNEELSTLDARIKRANDARDVRRILVQLSQLEPRIGTTHSYVLARYIFLRAALYSKAARKNLVPVRASSTEMLEHALEEFVKASEILKGLMHASGVSIEEIRGYGLLQHSCTYEAAVAASNLLRWGSSPGVIPDMSILNPHEQKRVTAALRQHGGSLLKSAY